MANKVRVYGRAQNRTALGIVHAYVVMNPQVTLEELRKSFPNELCPDSGVKELFLPIEKAQKFNAKMNLYFTRPDEIIILSDGSQVAFAQVWSKTSFERIVTHGKHYDIEVADFEKTVYPGQKGGYRLEFLNGYVPVASKKNKNLFIFWILIGVIAIGVILFIVMK